MATIYVISEHQIDYDDYPIGLKTVVMVTMDPLLVEQVRESTRNGHTVRGRSGSVSVERFETGYISAHFAEQYPEFKP